MPQKHPYVLIIMSLYLSYTDNIDLTILPILCVKTRLTHCEIFASFSPVLYLLPSSSVNGLIRLFVHLSIHHVILTLFLSSYHHVILRNNYHWQKQCPCKTIEVRCQISQVPTAQNKCCPRGSVSGQQLQLHFTDCFQKSFDGHRRGAL